MKSLSKQPQQSLETFLWNPAIQTLWKSTPLTPDSPFHCSHTPAHLPQFIPQAATPTETTKPPLADPTGPLQTPKSPPLCGFSWQSRLSSSLCYLHFAAAVYIVQLQYFPALLHRVNVKQVLPNDVRQNTDIIKRLSEPGVYKRWRSHHWQDFSILLVVSQPCFLYFHEWTNRWKGR